MLDSLSNGGWALSVTVSYLISCPCHSASFSPFAARTQQYVKEQLGQAEEKVRCAIA